MTSKKVSHSFAMKRNSLTTVFIFLIKFCTCYLKIDDVNFAVNTKFNKVKIALNNSDSEKTLISFEAELVSVIKRAKISILLRNSAETPKSEKLFRCGNELFKTNVDVCKIAAIQSTTFAKVIMENFARTSNFELQCPLEPKNYSLTDFSVSDTFLLRFPREKKLCVDLTLQGSLKDKGKLEVMWQMKAWVRIKR